MASAEGVAGAWPPPETRSAEARCEELRRSELEARFRVGSLKSQLDKCRGKLKAAEEETKAVRRTAKNALALQTEVTRLEKLLSEAGVESGERSTIMSLRMEVARLRAAAPASEACRSRTAPRRSRNPEATIASLSEGNAVLKKGVRAAKDQAGRIKFLEREVDNHRAWLRGPAGGCWATAGSTACISTDRARQGAPAAGALGDQRDVAQGRQTYRGSWNAGAAGPGHRKKSRNRRARTARDAAGACSGSAGAPTVAA